MRICRALPRKPCSGPKSFTTFTPDASSTSTLGFPPIVDVWLTSIATRLSLSCGTYWSV